MSLSEQGTDLVLTGVALAGQASAGPHDITITGSRIASVIPTGAVRPARGAHVIDVHGATATPGLVDGHSHWVWGASQLDWLDLSPAKTLQEVQSLLAARRRLLGRGKWLLAHSAEYTAFTRRGGPHRRLIDDAAGDGPCYLKFFDLHSGLANSQAIELTGLEMVPAPSSGQVSSDHEGATGFLVEFEAMSLVERHVPQPTRAQMSVLAKRTLATMSQLGYTGAHMMNGRLEELDLVRDLDEHDQIPMRIECCWDVTPELDSAEALAALGLRGTSGKRWSLGAVKFWLDGVVDSGSAWLSHPDHHGGGTGPLWMPPERYRSLALAYANAGFRVATHAIGDAAISYALETYRQADNNVRHRIEHLEVTSDTNLQLLAGLDNVAASVQPPHMSYVSALRDDSWSHRIRDQRWQRAWSFRDIANSGVHLVMGTDWPSGLLDPRQAFYWAQERRAIGADPSSVIGRANQALTGSEVLAGFTTQAAWAVAREGQCGSLVPGHVADISLWDGDLTTLAPLTALGTTCLMTISECRIVHDAI